MRVLDLFSGIGGFSLGLERAGMTTVAFCEIEPYCRAVLRKHWPHVPCYDDVRSLTAKRLSADGIAVDVICGGFPCQDISCAGAGAGIEGERSGLWREYARLIGELRPRFAIMENAADLLYRGLGHILADLASLGRDAEWHCIQASDVGAEHERDRCYIVSYPHLQHGQEGLGLFPYLKATLSEARDRYRNSLWLASTLPPPRMVDGSAAWVDRRKRTEAIGNSVVWPIPEIIGRAIMEARP
jgi:DNA (cytosine-5)-methyltransferase 1